MLALAAAAILLASTRALPADPPNVRPLLHFTPQKNWTNDPNGLIFLDGEYHLFYQYNPFGDQWGHMSWGHAVSKDLFAWEHLPVAIPEADGVMAFSGTAVFDHDNTSGFGTPGHPAMVAIYTGHDEHAHRQHQNLAYSTDHGRTWTRYSGNPVLDLGLAEFRDPKVFWHAPTQRWIMVVSFAAERKALFCSSPDLKHWTRLSEFGPEGRRDVPNWECPDLFELPIGDDPKETRWVLVINVGGNGPDGGSGCQYFVGRFDGERFVNDNPPDKVLWLDRGKDFYAFQSYQDAPDAKRIGLAWMVNTHYAGATPTSPWRGQMTVPREFKLARTPNGIRVTQMPVATLAPFLKSQGGKQTVVDGRDIGAGVTPIDAAGQVALIQAEFDPGSAERFGVRVREHDNEFTVVGYDVARREMYIDRSHSGRLDIHQNFGEMQRAPLALSGRVSLTIVVDRTSVEAFGNNGLASISSLVFPAPSSNAFSVFAENGTARLVRLQISAAFDDLSPNLLHPSPGESHEK